MKKLVLKVICYNWSDDYKLDWNEKHYLIYDDMSMDYYIVHINRTNEFNVLLTEKEYASLMRNIKIASKRKKPLDGSTGHGYEISWCDGEAITWQNRLGYIDRDINQMRIVRLLKKIVFNRT